MAEIHCSDNVAAAAAIGVALVASTLIAVNGLVGIKGSRSVIRVTGSSQKTIRSDYIIWRGKISERAPTLQEAYIRLTSDAARFQAYLEARGIRRTEIFPLAIETHILHNSARSGASGYPPGDGASAETGSEQPAIGYLLDEAVEVRSSSVDRVDGAARKSTEIISQGIPLVSESPRYIYTHPGALKLAMLSEASSDARARADRIARSSGSKVGPLRYARMGVVQIEGLYDEEGVTDTGANDTASLYKKITAVVTAEYGIR